MIATAQADDDEPTGSRILEDETGVLATEATDEDIAAVMAKPRHGKWYLSLTHGDDDLLEAYLLDGKVQVDIEAGGRSWRLVSELQDISLHAILLAFNNGSDEWRQMATFEEPPLPPPNQKPPPPAAIIALVAFLVLAIAVPVVIGKPAWAVVGFCLLFPGVIAMALATKIREIRKSAAWKKASGRITKSELGQRDHNGQVVAIPNVEYEFTIGFDRHRGNRVSFAEIVAGPEAVKVVERYPAGKPVTVFHDPVNPAESTLERDMPSWVVGGWVFIAVAAAAIIATGYWVIER